MSIGPVSASKPKTQAKASSYRDVLMGYGSAFLLRGIRYIHEKLTKEKFDSVGWELQLFVMPRKINIDTIKSKYTADISKAISVYQAVSGSSVAVVFKRSSAEQAFLATSVLYEVFISDVFVAMINNDCETFVRYLTNKVKLESDDDYCQRAIRRNAIQVESVRHLTADRIREILDHSGSNVTFRTIGDLKSKANDFLSVSDKNRICALSASHCALFTLVKAIRNYLAHKSTRSRRALTAALSHQNLDPRFRVTDWTGKSVGLYLEKRTRAGTSVFIELLMEMIGISHQIAP